ncbi:MAG: MarR family transcriptional regulator, partial [Xanthobacteraceae bacterium]
GLVAVAADPDDKRGRLLTLTPAGRRLLARATPIWERTHAEVEARLAAGDPDRLRSNLNALSSLTSVKQS